MRKYRVEYQAETTYTDTKVEIPYKLGIILELSATSLEEAITIGWNILGDRIGSSKAKERFTLKAGEDLTLGK